MSLFRLKELEQEILCCGYIRKNYKNYLQFPMDLIHTLVTLLNPIFYWKFHNDLQMKKFCSISNGSCIKSEQFDIHNIKFFCTLFPNGCQSQYADSVMFYLEIASWPENIKSITLYFELFEKKTKSIWKNVEIFEKNRTYIVRGWNNWCLFSSQCQSQITLTFGVFIDILALNFETETLQKPITLDNKCEYKWIIDEHNPSTFVIGRCIFSPNFNNNCFTLYFNGKVLGL
eukprot:45571_1